MSDRAEIKHELRELARLAAPLAAAQAGTVLLGVVDAAVVGRYSSTALAAVGLGNSLYFAVAIVGMGIVMGVDPMISQAFGAGDAARARRLLWQGVWLSIITGVALTIPMVAMTLIPRAMHLGADITIGATMYILIRGVGLIPTLLFFVIRSYLQAQGVTRPMVVAMVAANVFNLGADIVLVFGGGVLPEWSGVLRAIPPFGVAGAAIASMLATVIQAVILAASAARIPLQGEHPRKAERSEIAKAFRVGLPIGLQWGAEVGIFSLVGVLAGKLGNAELASHQLVITIASFTFTVAVGIGAAGSVRVGRAIGARDAHATKLAGYVAFVGGGSWMVFAAAMFVLFPRQIVMLISNQADVIAVSVPLLAVAAVFQISDGLQAVGAGVLRGAGDTRYAFLANIFGHWVIGFPIAIALGFYMQQGIVGLWWGLCAGLTAVAVLLVIRFVKIARRGIKPIHSADEY